MLSLITVPLKQLVASPLNVRKANADEDIDSLAANIAAHGLKQNLVVVAGEEAGTFEVVAGERRRRALLKLVDEHVIRFDEAIPVLIEARSEGRATSLDENLQRVAMNPADEVTAYATIVDEHAAEPDPIAYCARRFGVTRHHVEQRLRLAALAPAILDALRAGTLAVDGAKAYGTFADHALQLQVFNAEEARGWGTKHAPAAIRDAMKSKTYPAAIAQARYVGLDAYRAAGGRSERELFMGADEGERLIDPALLDRLARERMAAELPAMAERDGFSAGLLTVGLWHTSQWPKAPSGFERAWALGRADVPKKQRARAIGVYALAADGAGLAFVGFFRPSAAAANASGGATIRGGGPTNAPETAAAIAASRRTAAIALRAARLAAVPSFAGTPFEGRACWPDADDWLRPVTDRDGARYVAVLVRVTPEEIEAHHAAAEAELDAESAAAEQERRRAAAGEVAAPAGEAAHA